MRRERAGWGRAGGTCEDAPRSRRGAWRANHPAPGAQWDTDADERESGRRLLFKRATRANRVRISLEKSPAKARPPVVVRVVRRCSASARLRERPLERGRAHRQARARAFARDAPRGTPRGPTFPRPGRPLRCDVARAPPGAPPGGARRLPRGDARRVRSCVGRVPPVHARHPRVARRRRRAAPLPRGDQPREVRAHRGDVRRAQSRPRRGAIEMAIRRIFIRRRRQRRTQSRRRLLRTRRIAVPPPSVPRARALARADHRVPVVRRSVPVRDEGGVRLEHDDDDGSGGGLVRRRARDAADVARRARLRRRHGPRGRREGRYWGSPGRGRYWRARRVRSFFRRFVYEML